MPDQDPPVLPQSNINPNAPVIATSYPQPVMSPQQLAAIQQAAQQAAAQQAPVQQAAVQQAAAQQAAAQQAAVQPAAQPAVTHQHEVVSEPVREQMREEIRLYSHSPLAYWWPVWIAGYIMAALSHFGGVEAQIGENARSAFYPSADLGVAFILTLFIVILITNVTVRGLASALVIMAAILTVVVLAYFRLWDTILTWFAGLNVYLNAGAYFWFSTLMFVTWLVTVFVVDHMSYWTIKPGQITESFVLGASSKSFDTQNMIIEKFRDDLFRHWILGMGSGDLRIETQGARREEIFLPNVFFIGSKIVQIQKLIATRPTEFGSPTFK